MTIYEGLTNLMLKMSVGKTYNANPSLFCVQAQDLSLKKNKKL